MLNVYKSNSKIRENKVGTNSKFWCSTSDRRGRRRARSRVGHEPALLLGNRSKASNRETELAAQSAPVVDQTSDTGNKNVGVIVIARVLGVYVVRSYFGIFYNCASRVMGMFKWLRKDFVQWDRNKRNLPSPDRRGLHNEAYRSALQAFLDRRRQPGERSEATQSPISSPPNNEIQDNRVFYKNTTKDKQLEEKSLIPGVPHIEASEVFEIGWVAGTEDRYLELISAEWQHTRISLRRSSHPDCFKVVRADLEILTKIRHPHTLLLMGTTQTDEHGIVAIFESVDCTLYNYLHEQGERISVQGAARCARQISDALRHAHARGIVHGAISSHCIFLSTSGTAKLGSWELAVRENKPKPYREWEKRLRSEIIRWQAPEMFYGDTPSRACDVYALTLLIWEMCTGRVPWSGMNEVEIEQQYIHWERGVPTNTYNFPPLLANLLDTGLQLDAKKRNLDMNRTHKFLRRVEFQYEDEKSIYIDRHSNNNNPQVKTFNAPVSVCPVVKSPGVTPKRESIEIRNSLMKKKLYSSKKTPADKREQKSSNNDTYSKKYVNKEAKETATDFKTKKNTNVYLDSRNKNIGQASCSNDRNQIPDVPEKTSKRDKLVYSEGKSQKKSGNNLQVKFNEKQNQVAYESSFCESSTATETLNTSSDESSTNDTITDIKKLKEILATKRTNFLYGTKAPTNLKVSEIPDVTQSSPQSKEKILGEVRGKSYEPCKPASHKINLEPQARKSPTAYNPTLIKPASCPNQRELQSNVSSKLRRSTLHPQTPDSNSSSYFETSLWRKEKLICLTKMRKYNPNESQNLSTIDKKTPTKTSGSPKADFTENDNIADEVSNVLTGDSVLTSETNLTRGEISQSTPLRAIKEALDRATNIIHSVTPNIDELDKLSPIKSLTNYDIVLDNTDVKKSIFESLNRSILGSSNIGDEIKSIEKSAIDERDSLLMIGEPRKETLLDETSIEDKEKSKCVSFGQTFHCPDTSNNDFENEMSPQPSMFDDSLAQQLQDFTSNDLLNSCADDPNDSVSHLAEKSLVSTATIFLSKKSQEKGCKACQRRNLLARRRSLPARLGQVRSTGNVSPLGRLPIRRGEVPNNVVEDLYIDDEFGDNLNINMILLEDEGEPEDQELLSSLLNSVNA